MLSIWNSQKFVAKSGVTDKILKQDKIESIADIKIYVAQKMIEVTNNVLKEKA